MQYAVDRDHDMCLYLGMLLRTRVNKKICFIINYKRQIFYRRILSRQQHACAYI